MIEIRVIGDPAPQGSKRFLGCSKKTGRGILVESSSRVKGWRESVKWAAFSALRERWTPLDGPLWCEMVFSLPRPKNAPRRVTHPDKKPDLSKLIRSTEDALTDAGVWTDDARVVSLGQTRKVFAGGSDPDALPVPGAVIRVRRIE